MIILLYQKHVHFQSLSSCIIKQFVVWKVNYKPLHKNKREFSRFESKPKSRIKQHIIYLTFLTVRSASSSKGHVTITIPQSVTENIITITHVLPKKFTGLLLSFANQYVMHSHRYIIAAQNNWFVASFYHFTQFSFCSVKTWITNYYSASS